MDQLTEDDSEDLPIMLDPVDNLDQPSSSILPFVTRELPRAEPSKAQDTSMLTCYDMAYLCDWP